MLKALSVAALIAVAGTVAAPAQAVPVTETAVVAVPVAVVATVAVEASPDAVVSYESPVVTTVAAPEPESVAVVAPEPEVLPVVVAPAVVKNISTTATPATEPGGTVEETVAEPTPVVVEEPAPTAPVEATPEAAATTPTTTEESEVQAPVTSTDSQEYVEGMSFLLPGEVYGGSYVGDSSAWVASGNRVVVSQTIRKVDPEAGPLGPTLDVFHVYATIGDAPTPEDLLNGTGTTTAK